MKNYCKIQWPDDKFIEEGTVLDVRFEEVLFQSDFDGTINWVPKKYVVEMIKK